MPGSIAAALIPELTMEAATARKLLERLPVAQRDWTPHPKSFTLGKLATHVVQLIGWSADCASTAELDVATYPPPPDWGTTAELIAQLDANLARSTAAIGALADADFLVPWTLRAGSQVFFTMPRGQVIRSMCFNHAIHHRGQLSLYLRLLDVPLPPMYGPTADER